MPAKRQTAGPSVPTQKRTRFASSPPAGNKAGEINDDLLEEDLPENAAQSRAKSRKQLKDQDGYGSDSSNDEEGVVPSRRADAKEDEDDDVDMFADDVEEKEKEKEKAKGKGKEKEFMDLKDIQGQEFGQDGDEDAGYDSEVERQRRKEGLDGDMGIDIIPFNMKAEMEEGRFTADGETYVANDKDPNEKHDVWLDGMDDDAILKAREAHKERERLEREREEREEKGLEGGKGEQDNLLRVAVDLMERGETVLEALQRLGKEVEDKRKKDEAGAKKKSWAEKQKDRKAAAEQEAQQAHDPYHTSNPFTNLSNVVAALTGTAQLDVYSLSRESIQRMLPAPPARNGNGSAPPAKDERQFQYRFSMAYVRNLPESQRPVEREVFGPYPILQLRQWRGTGAFGGPACENIELRQVGREKWGSWSEIAEV